MASSFLLDTSGWIALLNLRDAHHQEALNTWGQLLTSGHAIVLTDWVIAETGNGLARNKNASPFIGSLQRLLKAPDWN
jgi:predicted nucleic acid-binding protein